MTRLDRSDGMLDNVLEARNVPIVSPKPLAHQLAVSPTITIYSHGHPSHITGLTGWERQSVFWFSDLRSNRQQASSTHTCLACADRRAAQSGRYTTRRSATVHLHPRCIATHLVTVLLACDPSMCEMQEQQAGEKQDVDGAEHHSVSA